MVKFDEATASKKVRFQIFSEASLRVGPSVGSRTFWNNPRI